MKMIALLALAASLPACVMDRVPPRAAAYPGDGGKPGQTLPPRNSDQ